MLLDSLVHAVGIAYQDCERLGHDIIQPLADFGAQRPHLPGPTHKDLHHDLPRFHIMHDSEALALVIADLLKCQLIQ